jgi:hypothetical protein
MGAGGAGAGAGAGDAGAGRAGAGGVGVLGGFLATHRSHCSKTVNICYRPTTARFERNS